MFLNLKQWLVVRLIKNIQKYGPHTVEVLGKTYEISKDVFNPKYYYTSELMGKHIKITSEDEVLDMGTGSGIQAIIAGQIAKRVVATDISFHAVQSAKKNVKANGLENIVLVLQGDLFSPIHTDKKFNVILFTPPYLNGDPKTDFDHALFDIDKKLVRRFFKEAKGYLKSDGYIQMIYSSIAEPEVVLKISSELGWKHTLIAQKETRLEKFLIYRFTLN